MERPFPLNLGKTEQELLALLSQLQVDIDTEFDEQKTLESLCLSVAESEETVLMSVTLPCIEKVFLSSLNFTPEEIERVVTVIRGRIKKTPSPDVKGAIKNAGRILQTAHRATIDPTGELIEQTISRDPFLTKLQTFVQRIRESWKPGETPYSKILDDYTQYEQILNKISRTISFEFSDEQKKGIDRLASDLGFLMLDFWEHEGASDLINRLATQITQLKNKK